MVACPKETIVSLGEKATMLPWIDHGRGAKAALTPSGELLTGTGRPKCRPRTSAGKFEVDAPEWAEWSVEARLRPEVIALIRFRPQLLSAFDRDAKAFPSPRSWEFVSRILDSSPDTSVEHEMFAGTVGAGAATEFSGFLRMFRELPNIDATLLNPIGEPVPDAPAAQYAVASALAQRASDINFDRICLSIACPPSSAY
jgi:hypothetical protein